MRDVSSFGALLTYLPVKASSRQRLVAQYVAYRIHRGILAYVYSCRRLLSALKVMHRIDKYDVSLVRRTKYSACG